MRSNRRLAPVILLALTLILAACTPEGTRERGGDQGADPGNHATTVQLHGDEAGGQRMFYQTPSMGRAIERSGVGNAVSSES